MSEVTCIASLGPLHVPIHAACVRTRRVAMDGTTSKTKKQNLKWAASVLKAKAGISSKMAVPKKIAQKSRAKLRKKGQNIGGDDVLQSRIPERPSERIGMRGISLAIRT